MTQVRELANEHDLVLDEIRNLAEAWAYQASDYDEDTEQQIADGDAILAVFAKHGLPAKKPVPPPTMDPAWIDQLLKERKERQDDAMNTEQRRT